MCTNVARFDLAARPGRSCVFIKGSSRLYSTSAFDPFLLPLTHNMDTGSRVKMRAQNQRVSITMLVDELSPGLDSQGFIDISLLLPLRFSDLYRMHYHITGDHGFLSVRA